MGSPSASAVEAFIAHWQGREGGQERANYGLFLTQLCAVLDVPQPEPASARSEENDYVFERAVKEPNGDGTFTPRRIDLYKRGCFVLEAKQSRQPGGAKAIVPPSLKPTADLLEAASTSIGKRGASRSWDVLMMNARQQAEGYARCLPAAHGWPPFILVCDVGHCIQVYADFTGQGKNYAQFPDRQGFRIYLEDLRDSKVRERLRLVWTDPQALDPSRHAARVTSEIAARLAAVSRALERDKHPPEDVAMFLMRCLFTMFAEDVRLLPENSFRDLLAKCRDDPKKFGPMVTQLWEAMNKGGFAHAIEVHVKRFNGEFFRTHTVLSLDREEIGELYEAAKADWRDVEPAIFGTLLEQALDETERKKLGAHYTPRSYVERLVVATIMEPLRADWAQALSTAERQKSEGRSADAIATIKAFHDTLCATRILDPACGTGNFLYVSLELLKRLEGEVLEAIADLGGQEALSGLEGHSVDPHQFLGLEINARAAAIAELVLWIGYLQWHFRTKGGPPAEPILRAFHNIQVKDAVLEAEYDLARDDKGKPIERNGAAVYTYKNPKRPDWPEAEFIVGNPPFIGGKDVRARLTDDYAEALWEAHPKINESADFVMYWWDRAAEVLTAKKTVLRRFGLVTTNSISQMFQRRVMERHLNTKKSISLVMAVPDHAWTKATRDAAAVRIAMTVGEAGAKEGLLREVTREEALDTDTPNIDFKEIKGTINSDLTIGIDLAQVRGLRSNDGLCSRGMSLHGKGFIVKPQAAKLLGLGKRPGLEGHIRTYRNGRDLTSRSRGVMVIDLFGLESEEVRARYPEVYQHVQTTVKASREAQYAKSPTSDAETYAREWWIFGKPRSELRPALVKLNRYIATVETMKHRVFLFLDAAVLPDNKLIAVASDDAFVLGVLTSSFHCGWAIRAGGWLGVGNDPVYVKSRCFDPFPFPDATEAQKRSIGIIAEDLDAHRKQVLSEHGHLTLTDLYNVLDKLRAGARPGDLEVDDRRIFDDGLILILKELHDQLDFAVADAYGWPADLSDEQILARLVALNKERVAEESRGQVRWLRPEYQVPKFGTPGEKAEQIEADLASDIASEKKPAFPTDEVAQTAAVMAALASANGPNSPAAIAATFRQGKRVEKKVDAVLSSLARMGVIATETAGGGYRLHGRG